MARFDQKTALAKRTMTIHAIGVVFSSILAGLALFRSCESNQIAKIALETSRNSFFISNRPYVNIESCNPMSVVQASSQELRISVRCSLRNFGHTPAENLKVNSEIANLPGLRNVVIANSVPPSQPPSFTIGPSQLLIYEMSYTLNPQYYVIAESIKEIYTALESGSAEATIRLSITYATSFAPLKLFSTTGSLQCNKREVSMASQWEMI